MFKRRLRQFAFVTALVTVLGLMVPTVGLAAGSGPDDAMAPTRGATYHLSVGEEEWFAFTSAGADSDDNPSNVFIQLHAEPNGSAGFNIWSRQRLQARAVADDPDEDAPPVGAGSVITYKDGDETLTRFNGDLVWSAGFKQPTTYYVQVRQTGGQPSNYTLSISGDAVSFPTSVTPVQLAAASPGTGSSATDSAAPLTLPATGNQAAPASGPNTALLTTGQTMTVRPGQQQWYKIQFPAASDSEANPTVFAELIAQPSNGAKFTVWTPERLRARAVADNPDEDAPPVGAGTVISYTDGDNTLTRFGGNPVWQGDAKEGGTYYLVVEPTGSTPAQYQLRVNLQQ